MYCKYCISLQLTLNVIFTYIHVEQPRNMPELMLELLNSTHIPYETEYKCT